jgi:hypothetical protein
MYCSNCGKPLGENDQICPACQTVVKPTGKTPVQVLVKGKSSPEPAYSMAGFRDSFWVIGLKIWERILFVGILIGGIFLGAFALDRIFPDSVKLGYTQRLLLFSPAFIAAALVAFLVTAVLVVFIDMASDIAKIRHTLLNRKN